MSEQRGKSGGKARAQILTASRKREIASAASNVRWNKTRTSTERDVCVDKLDSLKNTVKNLSEKDRQVLLDYLLLLRQSEKPTSDQERKLNMWTNSLSLALSQMLGQTHHIFPPPLLTQARKILKDVTEFMSSNDLGNLHTAETKSMYNVLARILVSHAAVVSAKARIPLSMKLVLQTTTPVVSLFDNYFPGYVKAKLLKQVLIAAGSGITTHDDEDD
ncbi:MAG TPA: hypothetical protein VMW50_15105 [Dehalococcoidia bacterium]|nr:hypothetical protein [Dehalococcoidia bacterium]